MEIKEVFEKQQLQKLKLRSSTSQERLAKLKLLKSTFEKHKDEIIEALKSDLGRPALETELVEFVASLAEIKFTIKHLKKWMQNMPVAADITTMLGSSYIRYEPKGSSLIISPWNYPIYLSVVPIASAIAAGNTVILKPSEFAQSSANLLEKMLKQIFPPEEVFIAQGAVETSQTLLDLPFDHIFFTGSTQVGKIVMEKAAKHLSSVTLELGGKSPVIVDESANLTLAAEKIAWGKCINAGQTCIAPDYIFVDRKIQSDFIVKLKEAFSKIAPNAVDADYSKIISKKHFNRINEMKSIATKSSKSVALEGLVLEESQQIFPSIFIDPDDEQSLMQEEIFGPLLPIKIYDNIAEPISYINENSKPLALYIFSKKDKNIEHIIEETSSGGVCVNDVILHISNPHLPFGGINGSGLGSYHGFYGFKAFSHERAVFRQNKYLSITKFIAPPYKGKKWIIELLNKL